MVTFKSIEQTFYRVQSNKVFETFVIAIIIFSALVIGVKTYPVSPVVEKVVSVLDWMITVIFLIEIIIRFIGCPDKKNFFKNGWNIFDTLIVTVSLIPVQEGDVAIIGRLIRIFRVLRMVSIIPELRILLNSLVKALPQLGYVMLLMFIIFYIYAAVGATFFSHINPVLWGDIAVSMLTLFRVMTFEDWTDVMYETQTEYGFSWLYYLSFIFFTTFAFLNMIIGIIVNVLERERAKTEAAETTSQFEEEMNELDQIKTELTQMRQLMESYIASQNQQTQSQQTKSNDPASP